MDIIQGINLIILGCAIVAIIVAIISLQETAKTRRDMFLPIIISKNYLSQFKKYVMFCLQNVGHGIAVCPKAYLTGIKGANNIEGYFCKTTKIEEKEPREFLDHRTSQGYYYLTFDLSNVNFADLYNSDLKLEMYFKDIFARRVKTEYKLTLSKDGEYYKFFLENLAIKLPELK